MMRPFAAVLCVLAAVVFLTVTGVHRSYAEEKKSGTDQETEQSDEPTTLEEKLSKRVDIVLADVEVTSVLESINELTQANMVLDARALAEIEARGARRIDVRLEDVPLSSALKVILRTVGLDFAVYEHFVYVSTPERVRHESLESLQTRVFTLKTAAAKSLPKIVLQNPATGPSPPRR